MAAPMQQQASTLEDAFPNLQGASESATAAEAPAPEAGESNDTKGPPHSQRELYSSGVAACTPTEQPHATDGSKDDFG